MTPLLEVRNVSKYFGNVIALKDVSCLVEAGQVTCVLGDNGAGKSTFIKILSGVHQHSEGEYLVEGEEVHFHSPRDARERGIATVFQDLATVPLMSLWRNFFLGSEPTVGSGPLRRIDVKQARTIMREEMAKMGIDVRDPDQPVGTLSGGERQAVSIARAVYFGAKVLILDEPTSALGRQAVRRRAQVHRAGARARAGRDLHHPQPAPRVPGRATASSSSTGASCSATGRARRSRATSSSRRWPAAPSSTSSRTSSSARWATTRWPRDGHGDTDHRRRASHAPPDRRRRDRLRLARPGPQPLAAAHPHAVRRPRLRPRAGGLQRPRARAHRRTP